MAQRTWTRATLLKRLGTALAEELEGSALTGDDLLADPGTYLDQHSALDIIDLLRDAVVKEAMTR